MSSGKMPGAGIAVRWNGTRRLCSLDDGENWEPLRLNMPATSIRDLIIKDDDLAVATTGGVFGSWTTSRRFAS